MIAENKVRELRPDTDWDKGKAALAIARCMEVPREGIIYIGDDVTDEDVFKVLRSAGIGMRS